jgi:hypothetical protein
MAHCLCSLSPTTRLISFSLSNSRLHFFSVFTFKCFLCSCSLLFLTLFFNLIISKFCLAGMLLLINYSVNKPRLVILIDLGSLVFLHPFYSDFSSQCGTYGQRNLRSAKSDSKSLRSQLPKIIDCTRKCHKTQLVHNCNRPVHVQEFHPYNCPYSEVQNCSYAIKDWYALHSSVSCAIQYLF